MKRKLALVLMLVLMLLMIVPFEALAQETVDGTTDAANYQYNSSSRVSIAALGVRWVFYLDADEDIDYRYSLDDGDTWSAAITVSTNADNSVPYIAVYHESRDGVDYVHLTWYSWNPNPMAYIRGTLSADGSISWGTQYNSGASKRRAIAVDSNGYPWIGYGGDDVATEAYLTKSSTNDGTWVTDTANGFPVILKSSGAGVGGRPASIPVPLTAGKLAAVYTPGQNRSTERVYVKRWTGSAWGSEANTGLCPVYNFVSAVGQDDYAHIVLLERTTNDIEYVKYSYSTNSFSDYTTIYSNATATSAPVISMDSANNLHVFWENDPTDDHLYYAKYIYNESTWVSYYDLIDEIDDLPANGDHLNTDYTCDESRVGVYYIAGTTILKFKLLDEVLHVDTLTASPIGATTATLRGEIISLGLGSATERGFWINDSPSLSGATQEGNETGTFNVGVFTHGITGLTEGNKYYYIAYASNAYGEEYGTWSQFTAGGSAGGIAVLTLDPTEVGDFEATFNGNIVATGGSYLTMRGFQWGFSDTPTWLWDEGGNFTVGLFAHTPTDLEADSIYYVRAIAGNGTDTDYGQWIGFITEQPSYQSDEETEIGNSSLTPPLPGEPGGWIRPPKDWGNFVPGIPWTTVMWLVLTALVVLVGFALTKYAKSLAFLFIGLGFIIGVFSFFPKGGYLDWWIMFPYILVSWALISRQSERPLGE